MRLSIIYDVYIELCKLEIEILKKDKKLWKITFLDQIMSFLNVYSLFQNLIFQLAQPYLNIFQCQNCYSFYLLSPLTEAFWYQRYQEELGHLRVISYFEVQTANFDRKWQYCTWYQNQYFCFNPKGDYVRESRKNCINLHSNR